MTFEPRHIRELAELHGISPALVAELAELAVLVELRADPIACLARWHAAGRPAGDTNRLEFSGDESVRRIVASTICRLPPPVRHYAVEAVAWRETGRGNAAWISRAGRARSLPGDVGHEVNLCGRERDEDIPAVVCHELAHGFHLPIVADDEPERAEPPSIILDAHEALTARILSERACTDDDKSYNRARWIGARVHSELQADRQAVAWGYHRRRHAPDELELRRHFAAVYDRAAAYAAQLDEEPRDIGGTP